ncbi:uncharacterized protein LOC142609832 [Castanea sativa]|uniref:uncharacterized protein LOC142609832 n=1 Tax=Castanea sativa TaxID=21020 RepID=UPI003F65422F
MCSILFNAPSESSSMNSPTTKPSKQSSAHGRGKPITRNSLKRPPLLFLRASKPSLCLGHRCCHCLALHSRKEVVAKMVREKLKDGASNDPRADWKDIKELQAFCEFCGVQVLEGQRSGGFLTKIGVEKVIQQLDTHFGKVVTALQIKNKWDHLKKGWKQYNECFDNESGLGYDASTGLLQAPDEWWTRKITACPSAKTFKNKRLPNREAMNIMFGGTVATGKNAFCTSAQMPKETTEGSGDSADSTQFVDPQCEPFLNVDAMEVQGPSSLRVGPTMTKGKGLATNVHLFKPIFKKSKKKKKRSVAQEMSDSLKSISEVFLESRSVGTRTPFASTATAQVKTILDMVLSLPGVHSGHCLHLFSTVYFMEKEKGRHMFAALCDDKDLQLKWLENEYQRHPEFHF